MRDGWIWADWMLLAVAWIVWIVLFVYVLTEVLR